MPVARWLLVATLLAVFAQSARGEDKPVATEPPLTPQASEFFETKIRPLLAAKCFECHGAEKQESELRLDTRADVRRGNDDGPVIVPGDPERSRLIKAVRWGGEIKMPPKRQLPPESVALLTEWVKMGAPWPDGTNPGQSAPALSKEEAAKRHWAFQPVRLPELPAVKNGAWSRTPVDRFVLAKLEEKSLAPNPAADRRTLIRRVTFDLIGLPPTPEEVAAFVNDSSPEAYERVVDRLLASPHYGERWGRYWLDVARYADTKGYLFVEDRRLPYAYTYRDWVVRAFNEDLPYDQFLMQQVAADRLPRNGDDRSLAALGFLTVGRRFLNNKHDIIDDRLDVVTRGMMGLTVTRARCHDHKFDAIPTQDYYSLYGVFDSSIEKQVPLAAATEEYLQGLHQREGAVSGFVAAEHQKLLQRMRDRLAEYWLAANSAKLDQSGNMVDFNQSDKDVHPKLVARWQTYLLNAGKQFHPVLGPWQAVAKLPPENFGPQAAEALKKLDAEHPGQLNPLVKQAFETPPAKLDEVAQRYAKLLADVDAQWRQAQDAAKASGAAPPAALPDAAAEQIRQLIVAADWPGNIPEKDSEQFFERPARDQLKKLKGDITQWMASDKAPQQALILQDAEHPTQPHVLVRGNPSNAGPEVPRRFLALLDGPQRQPFQDGSGRLELARKIASKDNPLTARTIVNRVWMHHFGRGLVSTPSDFGIRSQPPTHPELLDYLARQLMDEGWSIKKLQRSIVLSATYQQTADDVPEKRAIDPENALLWRMNRQRLDFEAMRDSLLAVSGSLDLTLGGPSVDIAPTSAHRRTIYGYIERQNLPAMFRTFDFATPDAHSPQRFTTTIPQQALFFLNSPMAIEQAQALARRPEVMQPEDRAQRVARVYEIVYGRPASPEETALALRFLDSASAPGGEDHLSPWERYVQMLLSANEFVFID